jgi:hypothetical protein
MWTGNERTTKGVISVHVARRYGVLIGLLQPAGQHDNGSRLFTSEEATGRRFIRMEPALE